MPKLGMKSVQKSTSRVPNWNTLVHVMNDSDSTWWEKWEPGSR